MDTKCPKCQTSNPSDSKYCKECAAPLPHFEDIEVTETIEAPKEELTRGTTFAGRYEIIEELGKGGMGRVYRVEDKKLEQEVALKLIKPEIAKDKKTIERFRNELKLARNIRHKNVCGMFDLGETEGAHFITMEYVRGEDLRSSIRRFGQLPIGKSISIAKQICEGLSEAHRLGVVHRDLKSNNIMIDDEGNVRIMDFGIARSLEAKGITGAGVMIGTPEYMSPEQVEAKELDQRSDIYSLGIIMYEMLTGRLPFEADTPFAVGVKQKGEAPEDPRTSNPQITEDLSHVILKCLEKDKEYRYQKAGEIRSELNRIAESLPTAAHAVPQKKPLTSKEITVTLPAKKVFMPILLFMVFVALGLGIWLVFLKGKGELLQDRVPSVAVLPFEDLSPLKDQAHICDGMMVDINAKLNRLGKFDVRSRYVVKQYADQTIDPQVLGERLSVEYLLVGSIFSNKDDVQVNAELLRIADNKTLWTESYPRKFEEINSIQSDIAGKIAFELGVTLTPEDKAGLQKKHTENSEAYKLYQLGRYFYDKRNREDHKRAEEYYLQAIDLDPEYALAYSGLADVYMSQYRRGTGEKAREAALKALELDDTLAEAYTSLATIKLEVDWDFKGAEKDFEKALALNPDYPTLHHWYSRLLTMLGRHEEAIAEMERALELNPTELSINRNYGVAFICARQYERAIEQARKTYEMDPDFSLAKDMLAQAYMANSMFEEILDLYKDDEGSMYIRAVELLDLAKENRGEAVEILDEMVDSIADIWAAWLYAQLGEADKGFEHLDRAYKNHDGTLLFIKFWPGFDRFYSDPRFRDLLKKIGLDQ